MTNSNNTAILFFSRSAEEEAAIKNFFPKKGKNPNLQIAKELIRHSLDTFKKSGIPVYSSFSQNQHGNSFGLRLSNAIEDAFSEGYDSLIIVGNDCPQITPEILQKTKNLLRHKDSVIGPCEDGGVYLIGINKNTFDKRAFENLKWETSALASSFETDYIPERSISLQILEEYSDIDNGPDLIKTISKTPFLFRLRRLVLTYRASSPVNIIDRFYLNPASAFLGVNGLRGPPALL